MSENGFVPTFEQKSGKFLKKWEKWQKSGKRPKKWLLPRKSGIMATLSHSRRNFFALFFKVLQIFEKTTFLGVKKH